MRTFILLVACVLLGAPASAGDVEICATSPAKGAFEACSREIKAGGNQIDVARSYFNRGIAQEARGESKAAFEDYSRAIEINPKYSPPHNNRAYIYLSRKKYDNAFSDFNLAIEIDPTNFYALNARGKFLLDVKKNPERAIADFDKAIKLNSGFLVAYANRAFALESIGDKAGAVRDLNTAINLGPNKIQLKILKAKLKRLKS